MGFAENLKALREQTGVSQRQLASILGVVPSLVSFYESGKRKPSFDLICKIANHFGVTAGDLVGEYEQPPAEPAPQYSADEVALIVAYRDAEPIYRRVVLDILLMHRARQTEPTEQTEEGTQ